MNASSYLEGFLTVYGWMLYDTLYQLFSMLWLVFLPFMMLAYNYFRDVVTDDFYGSYGYFKSSFFNFIIMLLVLMFCVIPVDKITIKGTRINTVCTKGDALTSYYDKKGVQNSNFQFDTDQQGKVPILPSIVMRLAQGTNNVIYNTTPCVENVTNLAIAFDSSKVRDPKLVGEMNTFVNQCYKKARERLHNFSRNAGDEAVNKLAEKFAREYVENDLGKNWSGWGILTGVDKSKEINIQKEYMGSKLMLFLMEPHNSGMNYIESDKAKQAFNSVAVSPLYTNDTVTDMSSNSSDASAYQQQTGSGPVKCSSWWAKLKPKLEEDSLKDLTKNSLVEDKKKQCDDVIYDGIASMVCQNEVKRLQKMSTDTEYKEKSRQLLINSQFTYNGNIAMNQKEKSSVNTAVSAAFIGSLVGFIPGMGDNFLSNITSTATAFYGEMFMYKVIMKFLHPMLLMGVYAFWGIYLIVSSYRGEVVFKGLVLIYALLLLPSIWAIADHLDSYLFQAMFPFSDIKDLYSRGTNNIERMILDGAATVFYIIFPFILLYMISEAGGPRGDRFNNTTGSQATNIGRGLGGAAGQSAGTNLGGLQKKIGGLVKGRS
ncbi:MAG: conjugal transfer protein TraG N-terminal domain-containing protein [Pasteurella sp.]|nr:conjugal transfer protein TraG N-terminal domain-containing protein [Pasteurella sp.]